MAEFMVDPVELLKLADADEALGQLLGMAASILDQGSGAAIGAAGGAELSAALQHFMRQWGDELRRQSEGAAVNGANLRTAAQLYQGVEDRAAGI